MYHVYNKKWLQPAGSPAVDHNGFVPSPPLYHQHLLNDCHNGRRRGAQTLRSPAGHLELSHLVLLARLQEKMQRNCAWGTDIECHTVGILFAQAVLTVGLNFIRDSAAVLQVLSYAPLLLLSAVKDVICKVELAVDVDMNACSCQLNSKTVKAS